MFKRVRGDGVGHLITRVWDERLLQEDHSTKFAQPSASNHSHGSRNIHSIDRDDEVEVEEATKEGQGEDESDAEATASPTTRVHLE